MAEQEVSLQPGESKTVSFEATPKEAKTYQVSIDGLIGSFEAIEAPVEVIDFELAKPSVSPAEVAPGTAITITCPVTSACTKPQTITAKVIVYEGSILPGHGAVIVTKTSPAFSIPPGETYNVIIHHTAVAGTIDRRDVEVEIYIAGSLIKESEWDDVYYVVPAPVEEIIPGWVVETTYPSWVPSPSMQWTQPIYQTELVTTGVGLIPSADPEAYTQGQTWSSWDLYPLIWTKITILEYGVWGWEGGWQFTQERHFMGLVSNPTPSELTPAWSEQEYINYWRPKLPLETPQALMFLTHPELGTYFDSAALASICTEFENAGAADITNVYYAYGAGMAAGYVRLIIYDFDAFIDTVKAWPDWSQLYGFG